METPGFVLMFVLVVVLFPPNQVFWYESPNLFFLCPSGYVDFYVCLCFGFREAVLRHRFLVSLAASVSVQVFRLFLGLCVSVLTLIRGWAGFRICFLFGCLKIWCVGCFRS